MQVVRTPRLDTPLRPSQLFTSTFSVGKIRLGSLSGDQPDSAVGSEEKLGKAAAIPLTLRQTSSEGFVAPFELHALREERLFALALWFDASFTFGAQVGGSSRL